MWAGWLALPVVNSFRDMEPKVRSPHHAWYLFVVLLMWTLSAACPRAFSYRYKLEYLACCFDRWWVQRIGEAWGCPVTSSRFAYCISICSRFTMITRQIGGCGNLRSYNEKKFGQPWQTSALNWIIKSLDVFRLKVDAWLAYHTQGTYRDGTSFYSFFLWVLLELECDTETIMLSPSCFIPIPVQPEDH